MNTRPLTRCSTALAIALIIAAGAAAAARDAPGPAPPRPISSIVAEREGSHVVIRGIVRASAGEHIYSVADSTGHIAVRIPQTLLTGGLALTPGTPVEVEGVLSLRPGRGIEVEARRVIVRRAADAPLGAGNVQIR